MLVGAVQGLIMSLILWIKKGKNPAEMVLAIWIPLMVIHLFLSYLISHNPGESFLLVIINSSIPFFQAPLIYLYFSVLFLGKIKFKKISPHFLPPVIGLFVYLFQLNIPWLLQALFWYIILSVPLYCLWILVTWIKLTRKAASPLKQQSKWLIYPLIGLILIWTSFIVLRFVPIFKINDLHTYFFIAVTVFVYLIAFHLYQMGQKKAFVFLGDPEIKAQTLESALKYSKSGLSSEKALELQQKLILLMDQEKPHLDPDLSLGKLAEKLEVRPNHLSQVLNEREGLSLNEFLNNYRLDEFTRLCQQPSNTGKPLLRIALEAGFNSKSSFNRVFRKKMGISPSDYRSQINKN